MLSVAMNMSTLEHFTAMKSTHTKESVKSIVVKNVVCINGCNLVN